MRVSGRVRRGLIGCAGVFAAALVLGGTAQDGGAGGAETVSREEAIRAGIARIVAMEESDPNADGRHARGEWPYEGVYRVRGQIPIGYRVGGTAIAILAMTREPGYAEDAARRDAVARGVEFVCASIGHPLMSIEEYDGGYDVRGWGYTYGLMMLAELKQRGLIPEAHKDASEKAWAFFLEGIEGTEIPEVGGWNYAGSWSGEGVAAEHFYDGADTPALFVAERAGIDVDDAMIERGLKYLESASAETGEFVYSGDGARGGGVPGATGRMLACETTLMLAGRGSVAGAERAGCVHRALGPA